VTRPATNVAAVLLAASVSKAAVAPQGMTDFNVVCPSPALCSTLESEYQRCRKDRKQASCSGFVDAMLRAFPTYDCQRSFDKTKTVNYVVPALWMCAEPRRPSGAGRDETYVAASGCAVLQECQLRIRERSSPSRTRRRFSGEIPEPIARDSQAGPVFGHGRYAQVARGPTTG